MTASATELRRTALYHVQKEGGGRFVDFHGWELPVQFSSILREHQSVRAACGLFDVSHMGQVFVEGPGALDFLQKVNANDVAKAPPGKAVYSHVLNERGGLVDDVIVSCLAKDRYLVVVNAATRHKDFEWFQRHAKGFDVRLEDKSDAYSMLALQGPQAARVLSQLAVQAVDLPRFGAMEGELYGQKTIITRTGYTGEDGFELIIPNETAVRVWQDLLTQGRSFGISPCGLGARDTLRLEAGLLLYGQDVDDEHTTLEANYGWVAKLDKGEFIGRDALVRQKKEGLKRRLTGLKLLERGVPRPGATVIADAKPLGTLASATYSPTLEIGIGVGYLSDPRLEPGRRVAVELHGRKIPAEISAVPFYKAKKPS
ncbi:MAG: glycine cleavage system aminomethyltransferase GcvT [Elusimicrobia bacterium]|nr:glycine cleavage system aminomethyltransferase GcvT [Elusimicrobiota bacterium]